MTQTKEDKFLYQINFNKRKYPEVCDELEAAKERTGGIAWYLRKLIEKDIAMKRSLGWEEPVVPKQRFELVQPARKEEKRGVESIELPDDSGGFM